MRTVLIGGVMVLACAPGHGKADCSIRNPQHFASARAVGCFEPSKESAIAAFDRFGYDSDMLGKDYVRATLVEAGCFVMREDTPGALQIKPFGYDPVPTPTGWRKIVAISFVSEEGGTAAFIDDQYLSDECGTRAKATAGTSPP